MTLALCGYATRWDHIVHHHWDTVILCPNVFAKTLRSGATVRMLLNHNDDNCVGSTKDGTLQLHADEHGLAFRYYIIDTESGRHVQSMAEQGSDCISVGFDWHGASKETRCINGVETLCIVSTTLWEISYLTGRGAVKSAYGTLKDTDHFKTLGEECSGGRFLYHGAAVEFSRSLKALML